MRLGTWTQGYAGRGGNETEIHPRGVEQQGMKACTGGLNRAVPSPLRESESARCSHLPPFQYLSQGEERLESVRTFLRSHQTHKPLPISMSFFLILFFFYKQTQ